ncbi:MAG: response regulator [Magnetococcales bacterium]|nr:response regulator [Magnetococcales bacterium]
MMRIDCFVKESYPRIDSLEELSTISSDSYLDGYVVAFKDGKLAGICSLQEKNRPPKPQLEPKAHLGETVDEVLERLQKSGRPALPVYDQGSFVGVVSNQTLTKCKDSLLNSVASKEDVEKRALKDEVAKLNQELSQLKAWTQRANQARAVSCELMQSSLQSLSLKEQLGKALDLIFSVPWLSVQSRGLVFLAEPDGSLKMAVHRNVSEHLMGTCSTVAPGYCLCGRAALNKKPIFASSIDECHEVLYDGIQPHGHYCYPIMLEDRLLGVLTLYLAENHVYDPEEEDFLHSISNILAGLIERKQVEDALKKSKDEAESASLAKTSFLANVSHEIRTPLNAIVGFSRLLLKHKSQISPRFIQYLENIRVSGVGLSEIINNVLDLAKIEAGKVEMEEEDVDIRLLVQSLYQIMKDRAAEKGVMVAYNVDPALPKKILIDRTRLNQVLMNLMDNAVKFTPKGGKVNMELMREEQEMLVKISDEGIGIPEDRLGAIFNHFEQADGSTTRQYGGTGLGLAIVKSLTDVMGGSVTATSELGVGSTFLVHLPILNVGVMESVVEQVDWRNYTFRDDVKILLAEDNAMNQEMLLAVLEDVGLKARIAENGRVGVDMAISWVPDIILMDLHMPVLDGLGAAREIRQHPKISHIPIIGLSADAFVELEGQAEEAGITKFLTKPIDLDRLMPLLKEYLGTQEDDDPSQLDDKDRPPLPADLTEKMVEGLNELQELPLFESGKIVNLCESLSSQCAGYQTHFGDGFDRIREAVYARDSKSIAKIITEVLENKE